ncbi:MAG: hypothetical protein IJD43_13555 [Thermoguttaceae bacterium]|nr:hypothetical protein [Thermoguttaceae bacterium]
MKYAPGGKAVRINRSSRVSESDALAAENWPKRKSIAAGNVQGPECFQIGLFLSILSWICPGVKMLGKMQVEKLGNFLKFFIFIPLLERNFVLK